MLKRIVILNSSTFGKAIVRLDDCDTIQLVGPNNVGKSTLIFALNFLFIIDGKKMTFVDNKTGDKETIHHYFPSPVNSYIVFEIFKQRYYCILLKRNNDGELEYYKFDHEYKDDFFIKTEDNQQSVLRFEDVRTQLLNSGITLHTFKDRREVFNFVYQRSKKNNGVVWLEDNVMSDGLSNNFSKVYRYLINSKLITNKTLKEALIIADNRDKEVLNFSQKSKKDINDLLRINDDIKAISSIQRDFYVFREVVNRYNAKAKILGELSFSFNQLYQPTIIETESNFLIKKKEISDTTIELNETLNPRKQQLDREIGGKGTELKHNQDQQLDLHKQINEINSFEGIDFLKQIFANLDEKRKTIETRITSIQTRGLSAKQIEQKILSLSQTIERIDKQIQNYSNQLIHKITDNQKNKEILNYILSSNFAASAVDSIEKKVNKIDTLMSFFDGEIKLNDEFKRKEIPSIEMLKEELISCEKEQDEYQKLLPIAKDFEAAKEELKIVKDSIKEVNEKIRKTELKPGLEAKLVELETLFSNIAIEKGKLEKDLIQLTDEIAKKTDSITILTEAKDKLDERAKELQRWKSEIENITVELKENERSEGLDLIYSKIKFHNSERENLKSNKDITFEKLKNKIKSTHADEEEFVRYVEDEIACLSDKQKSVETILQAISTQFANPAHILVKRYGEFREFVTNKFNSKLGRTRISDIESLKIVLNDNTKVIDDLKKISSIDEFTPQTSFDFDKTENLKILNSYLDLGKKIDFEELFDIELHLTKDGKEKKVDLIKQVESTGTDIMIRLVIIMSVINRLAINDRHNKITIAIDEIARVDGENRFELFKFCKEHNFIPICTSTEETILDGFDKYILLYRPQKGKKVNISESYPNVITQENLDGNEGT
jgi:conjugal transfer/entry exclusion protein